MNEELISFINETYLDQVEQIVEAKIADNGDILCIAQDGPKQLAVKITDNEIFIRLLNPNDILAQPDPPPQPVTLSDPLPSLEQVIALFAEETLEFAAGKKNCKKGISCGNSCISANKVCKKELPAAAAAKVPPLKKLAKSGQQQDKYRDSLNPDFHDFYDLVQGKQPDEVKISAVNLDLAEGFMDQSSSSKPKIKKMQTESSAISEAEAKGLATWISFDGLYRQMNSRLYDPAEWTDADKAQAVLTTNLLAAKALAKLPPATADKIAKEAKLKGEPFDPQAPLMRHMQVPDIAAFAQRYQQALVNGGEIREDVLFATTHLPNLWAAGGNVKYVVKPKLDGTGQGRYIDHFKNAASEGEILYPPQSRFRVTQVDIPPAVKVGKFKFKHTPEDAQAIETVNNVGFFKDAFGKSWKSKYKEATGKTAPKGLDLSELETKASAAKTKELQAKLDHESKKASANKVTIHMEEY